jgi:uncharacterized membrane protein
MKGIDKFTIFLITIVFLGCGLSTFLDKLAANRMGTRGFLIYLFSMSATVLVLIFYLLWGYKIWGFDRLGTLWVTIARTLGLITLIALYLAFTRAEASWVVAITALYPVFTIILAFVFLHESITLHKIIGIILAMTALVFLSI